MLKKSIKEFEKINKDLLLFQELVYMLEHQQKNTIQIYYNKSLKEYHKVHRTIKAIFRLYYFLHMQEKVKKYVNKCNLCHKIKSSRHKSYEEIR